MGLLSRHVSELKSEEFVLGCSVGWVGEKRTDASGKELDALQSTKIEIVSQKASKNWTGYTGIMQSVADASVGASMVGRAFPARCIVTYRRVAATEKKTMEGSTIEKDVEKLLVVAMEYICQVDLVDVKIAKAA
jgi:hypothetical protein